MANETVQNMISLTTRIWIDRILLWYAAFMTHLIKVNGYACLSNIRPQVSTSTCKFSGIQFAADKQANVCQVVFSVTKNTFGCVLVCLLAYLPAPDGIPENIIVSTSLD